LGVSGPAAGLALIVGSSVATLGGSWEAFLVAVVLAGVIQIILGLVKAGFVVNFFPSSVIHGMLTAIGVIIALKQIPHLLGDDRDAEGDLAFIQKDHENTFSEIIAAFETANMGAVIIGIVGLIILISWRYIFPKPKGIMSILQAPLVVVVAGIGIVAGYDAGWFPFALAGDELVNVPAITNKEDFNAAFSFPDFSVLSDTNVYGIAIAVALIASIETLLCSEATDKLDPLKRYSPPNRELIAQGTGNILSGLIGGLPITQVIVRSSTNIQFGGTSKMSAIIHGFFLLFSTVVLVSVLNMIPMAALAAILFMVGFKLAHPKVFVQFFKAGWKEYIPFMATVTGILFTDLLIGIGIGMGVSILLIMYGLVTSPIGRKSYRKNGSKTSGVISITLPEEVTFLNKASIRRKLLEVPENSLLVINASLTRNIHFDVMEIISDFITSSHEKNIKVDLIGEVFRKAEMVFENVHNPEPATQEDQKNHTPLDVLSALKTGNQRFITNTRVERDNEALIKQTSVGQFPLAAILGCIDSRTTAELIFDQSIGDIFSIRVAGNVLNDDVLGSLEFSCHVAGSKLIVVLGHTRCGAVKGACMNVKFGNLTSLLDKIKPAIEAELKFSPSKENDTSFHNRVSKRNAILVAREITERSEILRNLLKQGEIAILPAMYDVETGEVDFIETELQTMKVPVTTKAIA
jgi:MFS superfamily sulfate permease-like transporter